MNGALVSRPMLEALGWTLLHFLWQGTLVAVLLAVADTFLRKRPANIRYAASCAAMLLLLVLPAITFSALYATKPSANIQMPRQARSSGERTVGQIEFVDEQMVFASQLTD